MLAGHETVTRRLGLIGPLPQPMDTMSLASSGTTNSNVVPVLMTSPVFAYRRRDGSGSFPPPDVWRAGVLLLVGNATTPSTFSQSRGGGSWSIKPLHVNSTEDTMDDPAAADVDEEAADPLALVGVGFGTRVDEVSLQLTTARPTKTAVTTCSESASLPALVRAIRPGSHASRQNQRVTRSRHATFPAS